MAKYPDGRGGLGRLGESLAERFLKTKGYQILEKNFRCRLGELDLIAKESGEIVFVEVKCRRGTAFGLPEEQISWRKRKKLGQLVQFYLKRSRRDEAVRIDVVAILLGRNGSVLSMEVIPNAVSLSC